MTEDLFLKEAAEQMVSQLFHLIYKEHTIIKKILLCGIEYTKLLNAFCQAYIFLSPIKILPEKINLSYVQKYKISKYSIKR